MGTGSFDDEIQQVPSRDDMDRYFAPNIFIPNSLSHLYLNLASMVVSFKKCKRFLLHF